MTTCRYLGKGSPAAHERRLIPTVCMKILVAEDDLKNLSVEKRKTMWREAIEYAEPQVLVATTPDKKIVGFIDNNF